MFQIDPDLFLPKNSIGDRTARLIPSCSYLGKYPKWPRDKMAQRNNGPKRKLPKEELSRGKTAHGENGPAPF